LINDTVLFDAVVSAVPTWKMNTAFGSPWASRVNVPVIPRLVLAVYTPPTKVRPPASGGRAAVVDRPAASL
jgi:hypothetical protein